jgi:Reverse transcriptase (RNA-dependent DNA polymerase).
MDTLRQTGAKAVYVANDAKSCYDRILLMVAYLTMRNYGISSLLAAKSTIETLLRMKHYVRTSYGDSTTYYGGDNWISTPHGCGQGNGYGPALWACISSPLLHLLRQQGHGTKIQCPISKLLIHIAAFAFVDDVDMIQQKITDKPIEAETNDYYYKF